MTSINLVSVAFTGFGRAAGGNQGQKLRALVLVDRAIGISGSFTQFLFDKAEWKRRTGLSDELSFQPLSANVVLFGFRSVLITTHRGFQNIFASLKPQRGGGGSGCGDERKTSKSDFFSRKTHS